MERSAIRGRLRRLHAHPGLRFAPSGLPKNKGGGTPADAEFTVPRASGARVAPRKGGLRRPPLAGALACRRSTTALAAATERRRSAPANALPAAELGRSGCYPLPAAMRLSGFPRRPVVVPAGRIAPEPPESGADETPPAGTVPAPAARHHPDGVPLGRGLIRQFVTILVTDVNSGLYIGNSHHTSSS